MAKLVFEVEATLQEFSDFADRLGYSSVVINGLDAEGKPITIPNPENKQDFLLRVLKEEIAKVFYNPFTSDIDKAVRDTREVEKESLRENIRQRVTVSVE
jgi:predicted metal-dependent RNase